MKCNCILTMFTVWSLFLFLAYHYLQRWRRKSTSVSKPFLQFDGFSEKCTTSFKVPSLNWLYEHPTTSQLLLLREQYWSISLLFSGILTYILAIHNFQKYSLCWGNTQRWMDSAETSQLSNLFLEFRLYLGWRSRETISFNSKKHIVCLFITRDKRI